MFPEVGQIRSLTHSTTGNSKRISTPDPGTRSKSMRVSRPSTQLMTSLWFTLKIETMKKNTFKIIFWLLPVLITSLTCCLENISPDEKKLVVVNHTNQSQLLEIWGTSGKMDTFYLEINPLDTFKRRWRPKVGKLDGNMIFRVGEQIQSSCYFSNGTVGGSIVEVQIYADSLIAGCLVD